MAGGHARRGAEHHAARLEACGDHDAAKHAEGVACRAVDVEAESDDRYKLAPRGGPSGGRELHERRRLVVSVHGAVGVYAGEELVAVEGNADGDGAWREAERGRCGAAREGGGGTGGGGGAVGAGAGGWLHLILQVGRADLRGEGGTPLGVAASAAQLRLRLAGGDALIGGGEEAEAGRGARVGEKADAAHVEACAAVHGTAGWED